VNSITAFRMIEADDKMAAGEEKDGRPRARNFNQVSREHSR